MGKMEVSLHNVARGPGLRHLEFAMEVYGIPPSTIPKEGPDRPSFSLVWAFFWDGGKVEGGDLGNLWVSGFWPLFVLEGLPVGQTDRLG